MYPAILGTDIRARPSRDTTRGQTVKVRSSALYAPCWCWASASRWCLCRVWRVATRRRFGSGGSVPGWCTPVCRSSAFCVICTSACWSSSREIALRTLLVVSGAARGFCAVLYTNELPLCNRVLPEKPVVARLVQQFPAFYETPKVHHSVHKILPLNTIPSQINPLLILPFNLLYGAFEY
jgi:hypothetical protein